MENRNSVDQRREAARRFIAAHRDELGRRGSLAATWRRRAGKKTGPYFLLVVRDAQARRRSVYLGTAGPLVDQVRAELAALQAPEREHRVFTRVKRQLRRALHDAQREQDIHLAEAGLWRKGCEVRGWRTMVARNQMAQLIAALQGNRRRRETTARNNSAARNKTCIGRVPGRCVQQPVLPSR